MKVMLISLLLFVGGCSTGEDQLWRTVKYTEDQRK